MKNLLGTLLKDKGTIGSGIVLGIISGLMSFTFLAFFNFMISSVIQEEYQEINVYYIVVFFAIVLLFVWSRRAMAFLFIKYSQHLFWKLRMEILSIILKSSYSELDSRRSEIQSALVHDVNVLTTASLNIIHFITSAVVLLSCFAYMYYLSGILFTITIVTCFIGVSVYLLGARKSNALFEKSRDLETGFMTNFMALLDGFREIHMDSKKGKAILNKNIEPIAENSYINNTSAFVGFLNNQIVGQILFYILIASILLYFSVKLDIEGVVTINFLFILLYVLGAIEGIMVLIPSLVQAQISYRRLIRLKEELNAQDFDESYQESDIVIDKFENIKVSDIEFHYEASSEEESFRIGPISFDINAGDIVFIYGGNGSGKTTLIHSLLGVLRPDKGQIEFNGHFLEASTYSTYKSMFAVVFNDFYLFDEFYGNADFDRDKANEYLKLFEIDANVKITETGFSTVYLSTGQRKRLALIAALLENKPIIVLDEWAADQDPHFRRKFYLEILPILKRENFTILAITHDDVYYSNCDKLLKMQYGKLLDQTDSKVHLDKLIAND